MLNNKNKFKSSIIGLWILRLTCILFILLLSLYFVSSCNDFYKFITIGGDFVDIISILVGLLISVLGNVLAISIFIRLKAIIIDEEGIRLKAKKINWNKIRKIKIYFALFPDSSQ